MLAKMSQLSEATDRSEPGKVKHSADAGGYGRKDDEDDEGKKVKSDAPKKGRGRPKKDADETGEVKKYDFSAFGSTGKDVKLKPWDKKKTTKHSLKDWIETVDQNMIAEAEQVEIKPASQTNTQVIQQGNKTLGTVNNPQLAAQIKQSIGKGEMSLNPDGQKMAEGDDDYSAKKAAAGKDIGKPGKNFAKIVKSSGGGEKGKRIAGAILAKLRGLKEADIPVHDGDMGAGLGAGRSQQFEGKKPDFLDVDKDKNKKESFKKAVADKEKKKVKEGLSQSLQAARLTGKSHGLKGHSHCGKNYEDMEEARMYHEGYKEGLDECYGMGSVLETEMPATVPGMADAAEPAMDEGNAFTAALNRTPAGGKFSVGGKTFTDHSSIEETGSMFESWDNELNNLLNEYAEIQEGMTVSISKGNQNQPDSVTVSAQDGEADQLLAAIKQAGLGLFGGDEAASMQQSTSPDAMTVDVDGQDGASDIDVVDDHEGMMNLIRKVTGGAGEPNVVAIGGDSDESEDDGDYEDEGDSEHDHEETHEASCNECGMMESGCECDHEKEVVDEVESEDQQEFEVSEDNAPDSEAAETTADENAEASEDQALATVDAAQDEEPVNEWANDAGDNAKDFDDESFKTDIDFMTKVISGGLNKEKSTGQTTVPVVASQLSRQMAHESVNDWKKLAGIK